MKTILEFGLLVLAMLGMFFTGIYWKRIAMFCRRLFTRSNKYYRWDNHRLELETILELVNKRLKLIDSRDKKWFELEEQINNVAKKIATRESNQKRKIREEVRNYLEELQK
jgi:hypothetical protein